MDGCWVLCQPSCSSPRTQEKMEAWDCLVISAYLKTIQVLRGQYKTCPILLTFPKHQHSACFLAPWSLCSQQICWSFSLKKAFILMILYTVYVTKLGFMDVYVHVTCTQIHSDWYNWKENCYCSFIRMQHDQNIWCELYVVDCFTVYRKSSSFEALQQQKFCVCSRSVFLLGDLTKWYQPLMNWYTRDSVLN